MSTNNERAADFAAAFETNVFVMMRYRETESFLTIERVLRSALLEYGLQARLARDAAFHDDVWANIVFYMESCKYGIAIFEEIDEREFNPNISMELGFMYARGRRCLLLKDQRMPRLPTDILGKIYRDFDSYHLEPTIGSQVTNWCEKDLWLKRADVRPLRRTRLDRYVLEKVDTARFKKRKSWADHVLSVLSEFEAGETLHIVWNEKEERLRKYYKDGIRWEGPYALNERDHSAVCERLGLETAGTELLETVPED